MSYNRHTYSFTKKNDEWFIPELGCSVPCGGVGSDPRVSTAPWLPYLMRVDSVCIQRAASSGIRQALGFSFVCSFRNHAECQAPCLAIDLPRESFLLSITRKRGVLVEAIIIMVTAFYLPRALLSLSVQH